jgi:hypothetical protein
MQVGWGMTFVFGVLWVSYITVGLALYLKNYSFNISSVLYHSLPSQILVTG